MRVILVLVVAGALTLPALAGASSPEATDPDPPGGTPAVAERALAASQTASDLAEELTQAPVAKEHDAQVDDPDYPQCGDDG